VAKALSLTWPQRRRITANTVFFISLGLALTGLIVWITSISPRKVPGAALHSSLTGHGTT
jgi:hypothetical protein